MTRVCRSIASAAVLGLVILLYASPGRAQATHPGAPAGDPPSTSHPGSAVGSVAGLVLDNRGAPIAGAMVSLVGRTVAAAMTDREGRFTVGGLPYGPYVVRAHLPGSRPSRTRAIQLESARLTLPPVELPRAGAGGSDGGTRLAGFGDSGMTAARADAPAPAPVEHAGGDGAGDESEAAWFLRHLPRSVLKDTTAAAWNPVPETDPGGGSPTDRPAGTPGRFASLFADIPVSGEVNLLATGSFDGPDEISSQGPLARNVTYVALRGTNFGGAWALRGAVMQGDLGSWFVASSYASTPSARHAYDVGLSYSTQRSDGADPAAVDGARNVGTVSARDRWTVSPRVVVGYGGRYERYDYLEGAGLLSPSIGVSVTPAERLRVRAAASQRALAPGAEEFAPQVVGIWLPPERAFSPLDAENRLRAEQTRHYEVSVERDVMGGLVMAVRAFRQRVDDQLVTVFGLPDQSAADAARYRVGTAGDVDARGWGVGVTHQFAGVLRSSVDYSVAMANWTPSSSADVIMLVAPSAVRQGAEEVRGLRTSVEAEIPLTATRVFALYQLNTALARGEAEGARPGGGTRFDVRVSQSLPFLNFSSAEWEALFNIRNLFREAGSDGSLYDEIVVIRPPKRIVGGIDGPVLSHSRADGGRIGGEAAASLFLAPEGDSHS